MGCFGAPNFLPTSKGGITALTLRLGAQNIGGSARNALFAHAWLPWETWKLLYTSPYCTTVYHWITRVVIRNGGEFRKEAAFNQAVL